MELLPESEEMGTAARERAAREVRELVSRYRISETDLRRVLHEVEREREKQALIESRKAEQAHRLARERALHVARQLVEFWRIEPRELAGRLSSPTQPDAMPAVKYRHPVTGESWNGMGAQPEWLRRALGKEGYRVAELRADSSTAAEDS
ncbi:H-NS family nucleoid-associated regulatory protein [Rubrivivax gelatinosus]|uniref:H-NS histone family protein n=1 Tax=Rubrivivax gelatinosus TaxID=28068 RepID=A0A4R2M9P5_RUBGE|nr:H-NS family nucleoid-associated regulatory protein [Rubrivivax gelatinosus]TCP03402.1 H-NS histone family protein [Rubrivivax gelatinosus]